MNKAQRKKIGKMTARLQEIQASILEIMEEFETINNDEQEKFDNMPESLQESEKAQAMEEAISQLEEVTASLQQAHDEIDNALSQEVCQP